MPRSLLEFENVLPDALIIPHPIFPKHVKQARWWAYPGTASIVISEYNKLLLAWVRQKIEPIIEKLGISDPLIKRSWGKG
jgi:uncharacterized SAM-binding protein YcdF (DUF218 family)